jgi:hypothetical protein
VAGCRSGFAVLVGFGALLALSGCIATSDISVRRVDGVLEFVNCYQFTANQVKVLADTAGTDSEGLDLAWVAKGDDVALPGGSSVIYGIAPQGMQNEGMPIAFDLSSGNVQFYLMYWKDGVYERNQFVQFKAEDIPEGGWLSSIRGEVAQPCE